MQELSDDQMDELFRKSAEEFDPPYNPDDWQAMNRALDEHGRTVTWERLLRWGVPIVLLLLLTGGFWLYNKPNPEGMANREAARSVPGAQRTDAHSTEAGQTPVPSSSGGIALGQGKTTPAPANAGQTAPSFQASPNAAENTSDVRTSPLVNLPQPSREETRNIDIPGEQTNTRSVGERSISKRVRKGVDSRLAQTSSVSDRPSGRPIPEAQASTGAEISIVGNRNRRTRNRQVVPPTAANSREESPIGYYGNGSTASGNRQVRSAAGKYEQAQTEAAPDTTAIQRLSLFIPTLNIRSLQRQSVNLRNRIRWQPDTVQQPTLTRQPFVCSPGTIPRLPVGL